MSAIVGDLRDAALLKGGRRRHARRRSFGSVENMFGAECWTRTCDLSLTRRMLYQLS